MYEGSDVDQLNDELSNMLHHIYRLGELRRRRWKASNQNFTNADFTARVQGVPGALGALWIRGYDTHEVATLSDLRDVYPGVYTAIYGVLVWMPASAMPFIAVPNEIARY